MPSLLLLPPLPPLPLMLLPLLPRARALVVLLGGVGRRIGWTTMTMMMMMMMMTTTTIMNMDAMRVPIPTPLRVESLLTRPPLPPQALVLPTLHPLLPPLQPLPLPPQPPRPPLPLLPCLCRWRHSLRHAHSGPPLPPRARCWGLKRMPVCPVLRHLRRR